MENDINIINLVKKGDVRAFDILVVKYQDRLVYSVFKFCKDFELSQDIAQEAFVKAFRNIDKFRGEEARFTPSSLPGFLTQFGLNLLSTPPQGNIFQTAATAAKEPFQTFQAAQLAERERRADTAEDIFGTALASEYDLTAKRLKSDDDSRWK